MATSKERPMLELSPEVKKDLNRFAEQVDERHIKIKLFNKYFTIVSLCMIIVGIFFLLRSENTQKVEYANLLTAYNKVKTDNTLINQKYIAVLAQKAVAKTPEKYVAKTQTFVFKRVGRSDVPLKQQRFVYASIKSTDTAFNAYNGSLHSTHWLLNKQPKTFGEILKAYSDYNYSNADKNTSLALKGSDEILIKTNKDSQNSAVGL